MNEPILCINNIKCGYGSKVVLQNVNFSVGEGELIGVIGPNGSGKSTLLKAITNIIPLEEGEVRFRGMAISQMSRKEIAKKIAVVLQNQEGTALNMTVEQLVLLGRIPHFTKYQWIERREDLEIIDESMQLTDIIHLRKRKVRTLSGGEMQRLFIARALAQRPMLLLLDEPTAHLDIAHQVRILELIRRLNKEFGLTVLMVLHDLNSASEYCHRLILLNEGRIYKSGYPEEVMDYETIEKVYKTVVVVERSPVSSRPHIFVVSEETKGLSNPVRQRK